MSESSKRDKSETKPNIFSKTYTSGCTKRIPKPKFIQFIQNSNPEWYQTFPPGELEDILGKIYSWNPDYAEVVLNAHELMDLDLNVETDWPEGYDVDDKLTVDEVIDLYNTEEPSG